jgi:hypothetical protein
MDKRGNMGRGQQTTPPMSTIQRSNRTLCDRSSRESAYKTGKNCGLGLDKRQPPKGIKNITNRGNTTQIQSQQINP